MSSDKHHIDEDLKREAPFLAALPKKQVFKLPDGYFDQFSKQILNQIERENRPVKQAVLRPLTGFWGRNSRRMAAVGLAMAATLTIVLVWKGLDRVSEDPDTFLKKELAMYSRAEMHQYLESNSTELDEELLLQTGVIPDAVLVSTENATEEQHSDYPKVIFQDVPDEAIEEYLYENLDDYDLEDQLL